LEKNNRIYSRGMLVKFLIKTGLYRNILLATVFTNILALAVPLYTMNVYDRVLPDFDQATLLTLTIGVGIALLFDFLLKIMRSESLNNLADNLGCHVEKDFFDRVLKDDNLSSKSIGQKLTIFQELSNIRGFQILKILPFLFDVPFFLLFVMIIYLISPTLAILPFLGAVLFLIIGAIGIYISNHYEDNKINNLQNKNNILLETFQGAETFNRLDAFDERSDKWSHALDETSKAQRPEAFIQNILTHSATFTIFLVSISIIYMGAYEVSENALTLGGLIAISILSSRALSPISALVPIISGYQNYKNSKDRTFHLLSDDIDIMNNEQSSEKKLQGGLSLKNVSYKYSKQNDFALQKINLEIKSKDRYAIIGASGTGKTTLIKMLSGILKPEEGAVLWDEFHLNSISTSQRSNHIGISSQEDYIFSGTLFDNVFMGVNKEFQNDEDHIATVCFLSGLDLFMKQSGYGWDTEILEKGSNLSTGAKQSISLARALMHKPQILILDEPLNGLDFTIEKRLIDNLPQWLNDRTFIMVTHRTSLLPLVENIILMEKGQIKNQGSRDDIVKALS